MHRAIVLGLTGVALAVTASILLAHGGDATKIHACVKNNNPGKGNLRIVGPSDVCAPSETALDWNIQGVTGAPGPAGKDAVSLWAHVNVDYANDGAPILSAGQGVDSVTKPTNQSGEPLKGFYDVTFDQNVTKCGVVVTPEPGGSFAVKAIILERELYQEPPFDRVSTFRVVLFDDAESFIDEHFNIMVTC